MEHFNYVDLIVLGIFILSSIVGIARGFTREFFGIIAWIGALFATIFGVVATAPYVQKYIEEPFIAAVVSGLFIFIVTLFILGSISRYLSIKIKSSLLGGLDRSLGLVFGLARSAALLVVAYLGASLVWKMEKWPEEVKQARSLPYVMNGADWLKKSIPKDLMESLGLGSEDKEEEKMDEAELDKSIDRVVFALSQPQVTANSSNDLKKQGYASEQRQELNRLVAKDDE